MSDTTLIINRILPILLLLGLGYWIRRTSFVSETTISDLRKLIVNLALPSVLFISFLQVDLDPAYIVVFIVVFALCVGMYVLGLKGPQFLAARGFKLFQVEHPYFPFLMTGFEYGMLGLSLFGSAYGLHNIGYIAVVDLGHEFFIWFVFLALLLTRRDGLRNTQQLGRAFITNPVVIGVIAGLVLNLLNLEDEMFSKAVLGGLMGTFGFLANLTIPLILIVVGYGIVIDRKAFQEVWLVPAVRLVLLIPLALLLNAVLLDWILDLEKGFRVALFVLLITPPPFIIPLYMRDDIPGERRYVNNVLTFYTLITIVIFVIYFAINPRLF